MDLSATVASPDGEIVDTAKLTVNSAHKAAGTVQDGSAKADIAATSDWMRLRGNDAFWANRTPSEVGTATGRWVSPDARSQGFGVDPASLDPASLAELVRRIVDAPEGTCQANVYVYGQTATLCTVPNWMVAVSQAVPHTVIAIGGYAQTTGPVRAVRSTRPTAGIGPLPLATAARQPRIVLADDSFYYSPYVLLQPHKPTESQVQQADNTIAEATPPAQPAPGTLANGRTIRSATADFRTWTVQGDTCSERQCPYRVQVTNIGNTPGTGVVGIDATGPLGEELASQEFPIALQPGESTTVGITYANPAKPGEGVVYSNARIWTKLDGSGVDMSVYQRLAAAGVDMSRVVGELSQTLQPTAIQLLDLTYRDSPTGRPRSPEEKKRMAERVVDDASERQLLPLLTELFTPGTLQNPEDVPSMISSMTAETLPSGLPEGYAEKKPKSVGRRRELQEAVFYANADRDGKLYFDGTYRASDGEDYRADIIYDGKVSGKPVKLCMQIKTIINLKNFSSNLGTAARQLNGENDQGDNAENCPPTFERVVKINLEPTPMNEIAFAWEQNSPNVDPKTGEMDLSTYLKNLPPATRQGLCGKNGLRVDRLVITNGTGIHEWTNLRELLDLPC